MASTPPLVALVTGANRGIGLEVVRQLAQRSCRVFLGARNLHQGQEAAGKLAQAGLTVEALGLDVTDPESIHRAAANLSAMAGGLDILVNNAGILLDENLTILNVSAEILQRTMETNVLGPLRLIQAFVPHMSRGARVVNVSSGGGQLSSPSNWSPAYCISKTALNAVTVQMALALGPKGISVNAVNPGWVRTDMGGAAAPRSVEEGAAGILWLALDAPETLTGGFFQDCKPIPW